LQSPGVLVNTGSLDRNKPMPIVERPMFEKPQMSRNKKSLMRWGTSSMSRSYVSEPTWWVERFELKPSVHVTDGLRVVPLRDGSTHWDQAKDGVPFEFCANCLVG
jgi:hypothetical protein